MRKLTTLLFSVLFTVLTFSQSPEWIRVLQASTNGMPVMDFVTADANYIYTAISLEGPVSWDGTDYTSVGLRDMLIQKTDFSGVVVWSKHFNAQTNGIIYAYAMRIDADGNIFVTGGFSGIALIGSNTITSSATVNGFIAKFDASGNGLWVTTFLTQGSGLSKLAIDGSGNSYLLSKSAKLIKFNSSGVQQWEQVYPDKTLQAIAVSGSNLYLGGALQTNTNFGTITLLKSGGYNTGYLVRADLDGVYNNSIVVGGSSTGDGSAVADIVTDSNGDLIITGAYTKDLVLGSISITNLSEGYYTYIAKCNSIFSFAWSKSSSSFTNTPRNMWNYRVFLDNSNNIYEYGQIPAAFTFGDVPVNPELGTFLIKFDANGTATNGYTLAFTSVNKAYVTTAGKILGGGILGFPYTDPLFLRQYSNSMIFEWLKMSSSIQAGSLSIHYIKHDATSNFYLRARVNGYCNYFGTDINVTSPVTVISKHDTDGKLLWVRQIADKENRTLMGSSFTLDKDNNVINLGLFQTSVTIGTETLSSANSGYEGYVVKYSTDGELLWAEPFNLGANLDQAFYPAVATDNDGNVLVTGALNPANFIIKFDASGNRLWSKTFPMESYYFSLISADANDNIYLTSELHLSSNSGSTTIGSVTLTQTNNDGATALIKFDKDGNALWAKTYGGVTGAATSDGWPCDINTDPAGNTYLWGWFANNAVFGTTTLVNPFAPNRGYSFYLAKINTSGDVIWVKPVYESGMAYNYGDLLDLDSKGGVFVGGHFDGKINIEGTEYTPEGTNDFFAAKFSDEGIFQWIKTIPSNATISTSFSSNGNNALTIAGSTGKNPTLGTFSIERASGFSCMVATLNDLHYLTISQNSITIDPAVDATKTVDIKSDGTWQASSDQSWVSLSNGNGSGKGSVILTTAGTSSVEAMNQTTTISGTGNGSLIITISRNTTDADRMGIITITGSGATKYLTIFQPGIITGVEDLSLPVEFTIYPNPSEGKFYIRTRAQVPGKMRIIIINPIGDVIKDVFPKWQSGEDQEINLTGYAKGIYFVEIETDRTKIVKKVTIR
jgi:hypothetical protein